MGSVVLNLGQEADARDAIHHAVEALAAGRLVVLPTETVYGIAASPFSPAAVRDLIDMVGVQPEFPLAYCVKSEADALDYAPDMPALARRIARRCWPGPLTLVMAGPHPDSVITRLPAESASLLEHPEGIALRVPAHPVIEQLMRLTAGPLVLARTAGAGLPDAVDGDDVVARYRDRVSLILHDGPCRFARPSTIIRVDHSGWKILREGVLDEVTLQGLNRVNILLVCTGNTCRSPMAEGLLKKRMGTSFGVPTDALEQAGIRIQSAGIAAMPGGAPSDEAVEVMHESGIDIGEHRSQMLNDRLVQEADLILTMTSGHRQMLLSQWPTAGNRVFVLGREQGDVFDPIGMPQEYYEACAQQIDQHLAWWTQEHPLFKKPDQKG